jgi:hypothetical protein
VSGESFVSVGGLAKARGQLTAWNVSFEMLLAGEALAAVRAIHRLVGSGTWRHFICSGARWVLHISERRGLVTGAVGVTRSAVVVVPCKFEGYSERATLFCCLLLPLPLLACCCSMLGQGACQEPVDGGRVCRRRAAQEADAGQRNESPKVQNDRRNRGGLEIKRLQETWNLQQKRERFSRHEG